MNKGRVQKLIAALRSGEYAQGKEKLRPTADKFCCLGVACDVYRKEVGGEWDGLRFRLPHADTTHVNYLPVSVKEWFGFSSENPTVAGRPLAYLNDEGSSFSQIADALEQELNK
jgi:hypothetical protein